MNELTQSEESIERQIPVYSHLEDQAGEPAERRSGQQIRHAPENMARDRESDNSGRRTTRAIR